MALIRTSCVRSLRVVSCVVPRPANTSNHRTPNRHRRHLAGYLGSFSMPPDIEERLGVRLLRIREDFRRELGNEHVHGTSEAPRSRRSDRTPPAATNRVI